MFKKLKKPKEIEMSDEIDLPENIPEEVLYVNENVLNQDEVQGHIVIIDGVEYILYVE